MFNSLSTPNKHTNSKSEQIFFSLNMCKSKKSRIFSWTKWNLVLLNTFCTRKFLLLFSLCFSFEFFFWSQLTNNLFDLEHAPNPLYFECRFSGFLFPKMPWRRNSFPKFYFYTLIDRLVKSTIFSLIPWKQKGKRSSFALLNYTIISSSSHFSRLQTHNCQENNSHGLLFSIGQSKKDFLIKNSNFGTRNMVTGFSGPKNAVLSRKQSNSNWLSTPSKGMQSKDLQMH